MKRKQLAAYAGVDVRTLRSWIKPHRRLLIKMGMLTDMVGCIKELLLEGKNVKIADLPNVHKDCPCFNAAEEYA